VIADRLHGAANCATNQRAFQRLVVIDRSARDRADYYASRLAVVMAMAIPRSGERTARWHHQRKAEHGCLNSCVCRCHMSLTSDYK
jgi:hypothetical protein